MFEQSCETKETIAVNEAKKMLENYELAEPTSHDWLKDYSHIFKKITQKDVGIINNIVEKKHFDKYVDSEEFIRKLPYSLPFTISKAIAENLIHSSLTKNQENLNLQKRYVKISGFIL